MSGDCVTVCVSGMYLEEKESAWIFNQEVVV